MLVTHAMFFDKCLHEADDVDLSCFRIEPAVNKFQLMACPYSIGLAECSIHPLLQHDS